MKPFKKTPGASYTQDKGAPPNVVEIDPTKLRPPPKITEKHVPTVYRKILKLEWVRSFSIKERLAILFGSQLVVMIGIATEHGPGKFQPILLGKVTKQTSPDEYMRHIVETMIEERRDKTGVQTEPLDNADRHDSKTQ